jgi:hypothetical protein
MAVRSARINNVTEPWTVDELAHAGHEHLDPAFVAGFDDKQGRPDPAEDLAVLVERGLGKGSTVIDLKALALARIAAFMRAGGVLRLRDLIYDFQPSQVEDVFASWFASAATEPARGYTREDFVEHIRTEHSTFRWLFEPMLTAAGFEVATVHFDRSVYGTYTCIKV